MKPFYLLNEGLAFLLELFTLGALGWWGFHVTGNVIGSLLLGLGSPAAAAVLWGMFAAPKARFTIPLPGVLLVKTLVFTACTAALYDLGDHARAEGFAVVAILNTVVITLGRNVLFPPADSSRSR